MNEQQGSSGPAKHHVPDYRYHTLVAVPYTHLTLPTSGLVEAFGRRW